jgi:hypothetical protein
MAKKLTQKSKPIPESMPRVMQGLLENKAKKYPETSGHFKDYQPINFPGGIYKYRL